MQKKKKVCPECGKKIKSTDVFCLECGANIHTQNIKSEKNMDDKHKEPSLESDESQVEKQKSSQEKSTINEKPVESSIPNETIACNQCGRELLINDEFCMDCGTKVNAEKGNVSINIKNKKQVCENCGKKLKKTDAFCLKCGTKAPPRPSNGVNTNKPKKFLTFILLFLILALLLTAVWYFGRDVFNNFLERSETSEHLLDTQNEILETTNQSVENNSAVIEEPLPESTMESDNINSSEVYYELK